MLGSPIGLTLAFTFSPIPTTLIFDDITITAQFDDLVVIEPKEFELTILD